jgi:dihydrofolate synthase/folylpolyglutamate synthase
LEENYRLSLGGNYQLKNLAGILASVEALNKLGYQISKQNLQDGLKKVKENTGLRGRWEVLRERPLLICDTAHNEDGIREVISQLNSLHRRGKLFLIWGMVNDKEHRKVVDLLPRDAEVIACQPDIPRALPATDMKRILEEVGFQSTLIPKVGDALDYCLKIAENEDVIYAGGSTFTVASIPEKYFQLKN